MSWLDGTSLAVGVCIGAAVLRACPLPPGPTLERTDKRIEKPGGDESPLDPDPPGAKPQILCVGLNPAYQKSMKFGALVVDAVNRADSIHFSAGGKGQHCAIAANLYSRGCAEVAQFLGEEGPAGTYIAEYLRSKGVPTSALTEWVPSIRTRMCTTLLYVPTIEFSSRLPGSFSHLIQARIGWSRYGNTGAMTELIDPSETIPEHHVGALTTRLMVRARARARVCVCVCCTTCSSTTCSFPHAKLMRPGGKQAAMVRPETRAVVICGTFPPGVGASLYTEIAAAKLGMGVHSAILVIDAYKGIGEALATGACDLLKINAAELHALVAGGEAGVEGLGREEQVLLSPSLSLTHTHTHTHTLSLSLFSLCLNWAT